MERGTKSALEELKRLATKAHADELVGRLRRAAQVLREPVPFEDKLQQADRRSSLYEPTWAAQDETEAKLLIYNTDSEQSFLDGGKADAVRLSPYFDSGSTVLDFGCGIGRVARFVAPECERLFAVDISERMLEFASERMAEHHNVTYVRSHDVVIPEVPSASVDLVYSFLVLQHVEREDAFLLLEELRRVLRKDGTLFVTFPNLLADEYLDAFLNYVRHPETRLPGRARFYTPQEVTRMVEAAGFEAELQGDVEILVVARPR